MILKVEMTTEKIAFIQKKKKLANFVALLNLFITKAFSAAF